MKFRVPEIFLGALLAVAVFALGFTVALSFVPSQQNTRASVKERHNETSTDDRLATYTLALDWLNAFLVASTIGLWIATRQSAKIAERALTELERPWLFLEGATISRRELPGQEIISNNWYIKLRWKNVGRSPAVIERCEFKLVDKDIIPAQPDYSNPGDLLTVAMVAQDTGFETNEVGPGPSIGTKNGQPVFFVFFGRLTYKELNGKLHHTGFAVEISPHIAAFSPHNNRAYDYYD
jgi:hypothetical protein